MLQFWTAGGCLNQLCSRTTSPDPGLHPCRCRPAGCQLFVGFSSPPPPFPSGNFLPHGMLYPSRYEVPNMHPCKAAISPPRPPQPDAAGPCVRQLTMRFGSTAQVLLKCRLKYYRISECSCISRCATPSILISVVHGHSDQNPLRR